MATSTPFVFSLLLLLLFSPSSNAHLLKLCMFDAIYQLGDSISDPGNLIGENPNTPCLPNDATGRCSNGLHMFDHFALDAGLPFINKDGLMDHGVNFAVAGSTALPFEVLLQNKILSQVTKSSLDHQLDWMFSHFNSICHNQRECNQQLRNDLFLVGEIEGNDYNHALFEGKSIQEVKDMVPNVVQSLKTAVEKVINYGATRIVIPGSFPIGCLPIYLTRFQTQDTTAYDTHHCLKDLNSFASYHNDQLKEAIKALKKENPRTVIVYGDYYDAFLSIFRHGSVVDENKGSLQKPCCETGGNFNLMHMCGVPGISVCPNPKERISLDGVHLTQKAYKIMASWLIHDIFPKLHCFR